MIDVYGRTITSSVVNGVTVYTAGGISISWNSPVPDSTVLTAFNGQAPQGWVAPTPVPETISHRQFYQQAAINTTITQTEALAAVQTGTIPTVLANIVNGMTDPNQQFAAKMLLSGASEFHRSHPMTASIGAALGWTSAQIDTFFIAASAL